MLFEPVALISRQAALGAFGHGLLEVQLTPWERISRPFGWKTANNKPWSPWRQV